ncbi:MAG: sulfatase [Candidatus Hydrogenedentes bacterium]|nr:sulfatase [Candidatus Hydrogenedentota bacterium]
MRRFIFAVIILAVTACGPSPTTAIHEPIDTATDRAASARPVTRLTQTYFVSRAKTTRAPLVLDPKAFTAVSVPADGPINGVRLEIPAFNASDYTECRVRLKASTTKQCRFTWQEPRKWTPKRNQDLSFAILDDGEFHDYTIDLNNVIFWSGPIRGISFLTDSGGSIELESCSLVYVAPEGPARTTLNNLTMESLDLDRAEWMITVPESAMFEAHAGMIVPGDTIPENASAKFSVTLSQPEGAPIALIQSTITHEDSGWTELNADLGAYAGQDITLVLEATAPRDVVSIWGNPMITSRARRASTPVVLISCDTTRADHLGCYGYSRDTSPNIDAFSREAVLFENAFTPETWTLTAHTSMLTGLYPTHHRVTSTTNLAEEIVTLPEALRDAGYATAAFTGYRIWLQPHRGLAHGFDKYSTPAITRDLFTTLEAVNPWLDKHAHAPFFLFFHNYDHHSKFRESECDGCDYPYYPPRSEFLKFSNEMPEPLSLRAPGRPQGTDLLFAVLEGRETLTPDEIEYAIALYDDSMRGVDHGVGELLDKLRALGVYDDAIIVITADHGEQFGENGEFLHEHVYEASAQVPLLVRFPKGAHGGTRVPAMTGLIDIMPTILEVAMLETPDADGQSLLRRLSGEVLPPQTTFIRRQRHIAVRTPEWKLIQNRHDGAEELYHLAIDPHEATNLIASAPPELETLRGELHRFFDVAPHGWHIAFESPSEDWRGNLVLSSDSPLETARLLYGGNMSRTDLFERTSHSLRATLGPLKREEILVRTQDPNARVLLHIESESPFNVHNGVDDVVAGTRFDATLDPAKPGKKTVSGPTPETPSFAIWFESESADGGTAVPLTDEEKAELESAGYASEAK